VNSLLAVFLPILVAYGATLAWCIDRWNAATQYFAHCWLLLPIAAFVLWRRRAMWANAPRQHDRRGLWLLVPGLLLHATGALLMVDSWSAASLVLTVPGAAWLALGRERLRGQWPVLWLVLFLVPLPIYVEGRVAFELKEVAVRGGAWLANVLGADIVRSGDHLRATGIDGALYVASACGGLRSLLAMTTLAYCLAFFTGGCGPWRRVVLVGLAPVCAIVANLVRIALLCGLLRWCGIDFAQGTGHDFANGAEWVALLATLLLLDRWWPRRVEGALPARIVTGSGAVGLLPPTMPRATTICLWSLAPVLLTLSLWRPAGGVADRAEGLPRTLAGYDWVPRGEDAEARFQRDLPQFRDLLGTSDFVWRTYRNADGTWLNIVALFHDTNWKSVHPPRICIEGSGMDVQSDDLWPVPGLGDGLAASRIVARRRRDGQVFVTLSVFGTGDWLAGDYWAFTWHHLPRAMLRANMSGFQLRVEMPVPDAAALEAVQQRCAAFLQALVPAARERLR
jgi:exosortase